MRYRTRTRAACLGAVAALAGSAPRIGTAAPQWNAGLAAGVAGTGGRFAWADTKFYGALRGELLFGRAAGLEVGPALELGTVGFADARFGAGATLLVPLDGVLAIAVTPAGYLRTGYGDATAGLSGRAFFGVHPFNRVGAYGLAAGLVVGVDRDIGTSPSSAYLLAAQVDGMVLVLPALLLVEWLRGPRD